MVTCPNWKSQKFIVKKMCQWTTYTKLTHNWHIFHWFLCQFTVYTQHWHMTYTFFPRFLVSMGSLHKNWHISYTFLGFFLPGFHISRVSKCVKYFKCVSCVNHQADTSIDTADTCVNNVSVFHTWCLTVNLGTGSSKNRKSILTVCVTRQKSGSTDAQS